MNKDKGFIIINLLVTVPVAGVFGYVVAMSSLEQARARAQDAYFKSVASACLPSMILCCDEGGSIQDVSGENICSDGGYGIYDSEHIKSVEVVSDCGGEYGYEFEVRMVSSADNGNVSRAVCTEEGCDFE